MVTPQDSWVLDAHPTSLPCSATGFPQPQITWYRINNGKKHQVNLDHRVRQLHNGTLVIGVAHASDNGKYICEASFFDTKILPDPITKEAKLEIRGLLLLVFGKRVFFFCRAIMRL